MVKENLNCKKLRIVIYALTTVFSKGVAQLLASKMISTSFGPQGLGIFGIWQNLSQILISFSNGAINNGIIINTAERKDDKEKIRDVLGSAMAITIVASIVLSLSVVIAFPFLKKVMLSDQISNYNIWIFALFLPFIGWSICLSNVQNGLQSTSDQLLMNILVPTIYLSLVYLATQLSDINLAILSLSTAQIFPLFILIFFLKRRLGYWPTGKVQFSGLSHKLLKHSIMSVAFTLSFPLATFLIRENILRSSSISMAGFLDSILRISAISSALLGSMVSIYFLPTLVKTDRSNILKKYHVLYKYLLALYGCGILFSLFGAKYIISLLYSDEFQIVSSLVWLQLLGDFFKTISFINMNFFVSRNLVRYFVALEMSFAAIYFSLCATTGFTNLEGIVKSYVFAYFLYSILSYIFFRRKVQE